MLRLAAIAAVLAVAGLTPEAARAEYQPPLASSDNTPTFAIGARGRFLLLPAWMFDPWLTNYSEMRSGSLGFEFTRRKGSLDIILSFDLSFYSLNDGNWLGKGKDPKLDTHYVQFRGLTLLSADVTFLWHKDITPWVAFMIGGGVGLGGLLGDIYVINNSDQLCTAENAGDLAKCHPVAPAQSQYVYKDQNGMTKPIGAITPEDPDFQRKLDATAAAQLECKRLKLPDCRDTAQHPYIHPAQEKPPVAVVFNFIVGLRFKIHRHFNFNVSGGFRNGWVFGGGPEFVF